MLARGDGVAPLLGRFAPDDDRPLALGDLAELGPPVDLGDDGRIGRLPGLEQLGHPRQAGGDVPGLGDLPRGLGQQLAGRDGLAVLDHDPGADGYGIAGPQLALLVHHVDVGVEVAVLALDDDGPAHAGDLVELLGDGDVRHHVGELDGPRVLGQNGGGVRVPLEDGVALGHLLLVGHPEHRGVGHGVAGAGPGLLAVEQDLPVPVDDHYLPGFLGDGLQVLEFQAAGHLGRHLALGRDPGGRPADVEGAQGQLGAGLADALGGHHPDGLAQVHHPSGPQVAAVALAAQAPFGLAGQHRADADLLDAGLLYLLRRFLVDLPAGLDDDIPGDGADHVVHDHPPQDAVAQGLDHLLALLEGPPLLAHDGAAVLLGDDDVLGHVHQPPGQVACLGGLEGGVGHALAGAVGGDEVLHHRQPLLEVVEDWCLDDLPAGQPLLGFGHQPPHPAQLPHLLPGAPGLGVHQHENRIESLLALRQPLDETLGHLAVDVGPGVDDLVVALGVGDDALAVLGLDFLGGLDAQLDEAVLLLGHDDVGQADGDAGLGGELEAHLLHLVHEHGRLVAAQLAERGEGQLAQGFLVQGFVDVAQLRRHDLVEDHPAGRGLQQPAVDLDLELGVGLDHPVGVGQDDLFRAGEDLALAPGPGLDLGQVVAADDHVLLGGDHRTPRGRQQHVVG